MRSKWTKLLTLPAAVFALGLGFSACTDQNPVAADLQVNQASAPRYSRSFIADYTQILRGETPDFSARDNSGIIDEDGGYLYVSGYMLTVPRGAVDGPTVFTMKLTDDGSVGAHLTATAVGSENVNDVGSAGFNKRLRLDYTYAYATSVPEHPELMRIAWRKADGSFEVEPTYVDTEMKIVHGLISHFSEYIVIFPGFTSGGSSLYSGRGSY